MTTVRTLADPLFHSIINKGEPTMNAESTAIDCQTGEERPSTSVITPSEGVLGTNVPIQGVSGNTYAPMDTSPQPQASRLDQLAMQLQETIKQIVLEVNNTKAQPELADTIEQVLTQANWFYDMVKESIDDIVGDALDDKLESIVEEKLEELLSEKLANARITVNF